MRGEGGGSGTGLGGLRARSGAAARALCGAEAGEPLPPYRAAPPRGSGRAERAPPLARTSLGLQLLQRLGPGGAPWDPSEVQEEGTGCGIANQRCDNTFCCFFLSPLLCVLAEGTLRCSGSVLPFSRAYLFLRPRITVLCDVLDACAKHGSVALLHSQLRV